MVNKFLCVVGCTAFAWSALFAQETPTGAAGEAQPAAEQVQAATVPQVVKEIGTLSGEPNEGAKYFIYLCSASWCGPCKALMPKVVEAYDEMQKAGVEVILVDCDFTQEAAKKYMESISAPFPGVFCKDAEQKLPGYLKGSAIPWMCIVDATGKLVKMGLGGDIFPKWREIIASAETQQPAEAETPPAPAAGSVAEALGEIKTLNSEPDLNATYYVYLESASWCAPCRKEMPKIAKAYPKMKEAGIEVILIGADTTPEAMMEYLRIFKAGFPAVHGQDKGVSRLPGYTPAAGIPSATFVDAKGRVIKSGHGAIILDWKNIINK